MPSGCSRSMRQRGSSSASSSWRTRAVTGRRRAARRSSAGPTGSSASRCSTRRRGSATARSTTRPCAQAEQQAEEAERLRLYYVAMTRAIDRLLVSGSIDPTRAQEARTPMAWVLDRLGSVALDEVGDEPLSRRAGAARLLVRVDRHRPRPREAARAPALPRGGAAVALHRPRRTCAAPAVELPPSSRSRRLRSSSRAGSRTARSRRSTSAPRSSTPVTSPGCASGARGGAGRRRCRLGGPRAAGGDRPRRAGRSRRPRRAPARCRRRGGATRIEGFLASYCGSSSQRGSRRSRARGGRQSFSFEHDGVVLHGFIDVLRSASTRSSSTSRRTRSRESRQQVSRRTTGLQRLVYALACFRAGANEVEVVYQFLEQPDAPVVTVFTAGDAPRLEEELSAAIARIRAGYVRANAERAGLRGLPGARRRLRRPAPANGRWRVASSRKPGDAWGRSGSASGR